MLSPDEITRRAPAAHETSAFFGYISGLADEDFLKFSIRYRGHPIVRHVFFSEVRKRPQLPTKAVDHIALNLLSEIENGNDRSKNEVFLRYLQPHLSKQMRTRMFRTIMRVGTKTTRNKLLRYLIPSEAPGIDEDVLAAALRDHDEHALVGIIYRWPLDLWQQHAEHLFAAAEGLPWLQRQIVFRSDKIDLFLDRSLISDPVTELYVRARYGRKVSLDLVDAAIDRAQDEQDILDRSKRAGLVAWCLGRLALFEKLKELETSMEAHDNDDFSWHPAEPS